MSDTSPQHRAVQVLETYMAKHGLKSSKQRDLIVQAFIHSHGHVSVDGLLEKVHERDEKVSQATVYRTLKLLTDCGVAQVRNFRRGQTLYELSDQHGHHHDHLVCTSCGKIVEFVQEDIERLQETVARKHGFELRDHRMVLYGLCSACKRAT